MCQNMRLVCMWNVGSIIVGLHLSCKASVNKHLGVTARSNLSVLEKGEISCPLGIEPQFVCHPAHSLFTTLAAKVTAKNIIVAVHILWQSVVKRVHRRLGHPMAYVCRHRGEVGVSAALWALYVLETPGTHWTEAGWALGPICTAWSHLQSPGHPDHGEMAIVTVASWPP